MNSSPIPGLRKDLSKQLKSIFSAESTQTFPSLAPPAALLELVEQYVLASKDASLSRSTTAKAKESSVTSGKPLSSYLPYLI